MSLTLVITRNGEPLFKWSVAGTDSIHITAHSAVIEEQRYGFELIDREPNNEYALWIGDVEAGSSVASDGRLAHTIGVARGRTVYWDDALYFDGSRGVVAIRLRSRLADASTWQDRADVSIVVTSSKLSEDRYRSMLDQMAGLASGLILDLVSKMQRSLRFFPIGPRSQVRSSIIELNLIEAVWPTVANCLEQIAHDPHVRLSRRPALSHCWGGERLDSRSLVSMVREGVDPTSAAVQVPFKCQIARISENTNTKEHRAISGFLQILYTKARECERDLLRHIASIEADRVWRDRSFSNGVSLYAQEDVPRRNELARRLRMVGTLMRQIQRASEMEFLRGVPSEVSLELTPVFANLEPYRRFYHQMLQVLRSGLIVLEQGIEERVKSTSRLYEQWVFLQLIAAFKATGLQCHSQQGVLHSTRQFRFTLDLDRGARVTFSDANGRVAVIRYEPWVMPYQQAVQSRDSVYRGIDGPTAWSPDVLIECFSNKGGTEADPVPDYGIVIDAKYTPIIREHHWASTGKYLQIRSTVDRKQIVHQQWLFYPGTAEQDECPIDIQDSSIEWTDSGPACSHDDRFSGSLRLTPPRSASASNTHSEWITEPETSVVSFVRGLIRFLGFDSG